jgi:hypothetical protein
VLFILQKNYFFAFVLQFLELKENEVEQVLSSGTASPAMIRLRLEAVAAFS